MKCPICTDERIEHHIEAPVITRETNNYVFRKYHCSVFNKSFHTHEYLQDTRNEPALKARLQEMKHTIGNAQMRLNEARRILEQLELGL